MISRIYIIVVGIITSTACFSQTGSENFGPAPPPNPSTFKLGSDNLGALTNAVNLFTGDLNLPLNVVSTPSRNGLNIGVSFFYNSNIHKLNDIWNLEAPTGILGLGWSIPTTKIVVDNKMTGTRDDDDFYLVDGGNSTKLICVNKASNPRVYKSKNYNEWLISYTPSSEKWEITKEDGSKSVYGDQFSGRSTVEWIVKWRNWIGNTSVTSGQQRQALIWNISEVKNIWGDRIFFRYENTDVAVGSGGQRQTEASYLTTISDNWGNEVEFIYGTKTSNEVQEPHIEQSEPDGYQERYERKYLDKIKVKNEGLTQSETVLNYTLGVGTGNLTKRLLASIKQVSVTGEFLPVISFEYKTSGFMNGALTKINHSTGGSITYEYSAEELISNANRDLVIDAPSGYSEPRVYFGNDYIVVTWRQGGSGHTFAPSPVKLEIYTWDGAWRKCEDLGALATISSVKLVGDFAPDWKISTGKDCFGILKPNYSGNDYTIYSFGRSERRTTWMGFSETINLGSHDEDREEVFAGDGFVSVTNNNGKIFTYTRTGNEFSTFWRRLDFTETTGGHATAMANNYVLSQYTTASPDQFKMYAFNEEKHWLTVNQSISFNNTDGNPKWHGSNAYAFNFKNLDNEFVFHWDENYNLLTPKNAGFSGTHDAQTFLTPEMMTFVEYSPAKLRSLRFDGSQWKSAGVKNITWYNKGYPGPDLLAWTERPNIEQAPLAYRQTYNANTNTWDGAFNIFGSDLVHGAGVNLVVFKDRSFFRRTDGTWYHITHTGESYARTRVLEKTIARSDGGSINWRSSEIKNGGIYSGGGGSGYFSVQPFYDANWHINPFIDLISGDLAVGSPSYDHYIDATTLTLTKDVNLGWLGMKDFPVKRIITNDGSGNLSYVSIQYDLSKAILDPTASIAQYNRAKVFPGTENLVSNPNGTFGYTEHYFFNGYPASDYPQLDLNDPEYSPYSNERLLRGSTYKTNTYNASNVLVGQQKVYWETYPKTITNSWGEALDRLYISRPMKTTNLVDGITRITENTYDENYFFLKSQTSYTLNSLDKTTHEFTYWWEKYDNNSPPRVRNIWTNVVETKKKINNQYIESIVSRWKNWPCSGTNCPTSTVPAPVDQYLWKGINSEVFSWWNTETQTPSGDWSFVQKINNRDNSCGAELEIVGKGNQILSTILDQKKRIVASVTNASNQQIYYNGFEETTTNFSNESATGIKSSSASLNVIAPSGGGSFSLTYWKKTGSGDWQLIEEPMASGANLTIGGGSGILIDEVRLYPVHARMTTTAYDKLGNAISTCDANNIISYIEYDGLNRPKLIRDEKKNIVKQTFYNIKN